VVLDTATSRYLVADENFDIDITKDPTYYYDIRKLSFLPQPVVDNTGIEYFPGDLTAVPPVPATISPSSTQDPRPVSDIDYLLVRDYRVIEEVFNQYRFNGSGLIGLNIYTEFAYQDYPAGAIYTVTPNSTNLDEVIPVLNENLFSRRGRGKTQDTSNPNPEKGIIRWNHVASSNTRIDPSISNVIENIVLTETYYARIQAWLANPTSQFPLPPTSSQLSRRTGKPPGSWQLNAGCTASPRKRRGYSAGSTVWNLPSM